MKVPGTVIMAVGFALTVSNVAAVVTAGEDCPIILLERSGGLGYEDRGGVVAAVWGSGKIIRAQSLDRPWDAHVQGHLPPDVLSGLLELVNADHTWNQPSGEVALDSGDDILTLRRGNEQRSWAESPGITSTPLVGQVRNRLATVKIERASRARAPFKELEACLK